MPRQVQLHRCRRNLKTPPRSFLLPLTGCREKPRYALVAAVPHPVARGHDRLILASPAPCQAGQPDTLSTLAPFEANQAAPLATIAEPLRTNISCGTAVRSTAV